MNATVLFSVSLVISLNICNYKEIDKIFEF